MHTVVKRAGEKEEFDQRKLYSSIVHPAVEAGYSEQEAEELAETVSGAVVDWLEGREEDVVTSKEVRGKVEQLLEDRDEDVAFMYAKYLDIS